MKTEIYMANQYSGYVYRVIVNRIGIVVEDVKLRKKTYQSITARLR